MEKLREIHILKKDIKYWEGEAACLRASRDVWAGKRLAEVETYCEVLREELKELEK